MSAAAAGAHIAGLPDAVRAGLEPVAVGRLVSESVEQHVRTYGEKVRPAFTELAFHIDPAGIEPARNAREAGRLLTRASADSGFRQHDLGAATDAIDMPLYHAALMGTDGRWFVARLRPHVDGAHAPNELLTQYHFNSMDTSVTRTTDRLRLLAHSSAGYPFRPGVDTVPVRRPNFEPEAFLGDTYQAPVLKAHVQDAIAGGESSAVQAQTLTGDRGLLRNQFSDLALHRSIHPGKWRLRDSLQAAQVELRRLLPEEVGRAPDDPDLVREVTALNTRFEDMLTRIRQLPTKSMPKDSYSRDEVNLINRTIGQITEELREVKIPQPRTAEAADDNLTAFDGLLQRITSSDFSRWQAMMAFDYARFGATPGERMRNVGIAFAALNERQGLGSDRGAAQLKRWLRGLAEDAGRVREEINLDPERFGSEADTMRTLLGRVEETATRNSQSIVRNRAGVVNREDPTFPDLGEVGRMGANLKLYLTIDDLGRVTPAPGVKLPQSFQF